MIGGNRLLFTQIDKTTTAISAANIEINMLKHFYGPSVRGSQSRKTPQQQSPHAPTKGLKFIVICYFVLDLFYF